MARVDVLRGLALACVVAGAAWAIEGAFEDADIVGLSAVFLAIVLGLVVRQVLPAASLVPGARFASDTVLKAGIVLLGIRFGLDDLGAVGGRGVLAICAALLAAAAVGFVVLRLDLLPRRLALLIAVGTAICGNSAIAATAPVLGAEDEEVSYASATITLFGMVLLVVLPVVGQALGLSAQQFGILAGAGVHDTAQAVATGFIFAAESGEVATVTKLARTMALIPLLMVLSITVGKGQGTAPGNLRGHVPLFAIGFVAMSLLRTALDVWVLPSAGIDQALELLSGTASACILIAMAGVGLTTRLGNLRRMGLRPLVVGLVWAVAVTTAAGLVAVTVS